MAAINKDFGSFENMKSKLSAVTVAVQGSGWGWLVMYTSCSIAFYYRTRILFSFLHLR